ncbi:MULTISPECIES: hypothetical protein [Methanothrix]|uniref:hypothetical protein n=1 Tax=Methanothrix TaxID=2222 RepID=UPI00257CA320|nr:MULTISPECIES: hypothetical protein [Methanothrix]
MSHVAARQEDGQGQTAQNATMLWQIFSSEAIVPAQDCRSCTASARGNGGMSQKSAGASLCLRVVMSTPQPPVMDRISVRSSAASVPSSTIRAWRLLKAIRAASKAPVRGSTP